MSFELESDLRVSYSKLELEESEELAELVESEESEKLEELKKSEVLEEPFLATFVANPPLYTMAETTFSIGSRILVVITEPSFSGQAGTKREELESHFSKSL